MILASLSHGVTFFTNVFALISEIAEQKGRDNGFFRGSKGEIRTEGLDMLLGVRVLAKATKRARITHR
jgi:hypothetical protein